MSTEQKQEEPKVPTKEELVAFFNEQIEVKKVQYELQELNTKLAVAKAEELKALAFIGQLSSPQGMPQQAEQFQKHTLTEDDFRANPELEESGYKVGDVIELEMDSRLLSEDEIKELEKEQTAKVKKLKKTS
jgi:hypothetical protein